MGYTQAEWDKLSQEQQEQIFKNHPANKKFTNTTTGFADYSLEKDPKTGKMVKVQHVHTIFDPETKEYV